ncbi:hypothetical protein SAMN05444336_102323 [Albimonas donghaensis]|uniref:Uncharacterized protein n=1 Tax=Albimonas donghaensis TaxID=356660 RepID=A0A1H2WBE7_9RHOB|nr:hypothetical protein [Albimonas donghaensis]SDW77845.1 hypothetical protein SAMN05444336_102323 [Albimonas donghaensis]
MSDYSDIRYLRDQCSDLESLIIISRESGDIVAEMNFSERLDEVLGELSRLESVDSNVGEIAILFDGAPVVERRAIDARFASDALNNFQGLVTRLFAANGEKGLASFGKIRGSELVDLNIVNIATGSFGFVLEEKSARQASVFPTPVREAMEEAVALFREFAQENEDDFLIEVNDINPRVFRSVAKLFSHLQRNEASIKAELPSASLSIDRFGVERAFRRISNSRVVIKNEVWFGALVGLSPIRRTFDFRKSGEIGFVSGRFGHQVSQDYLEKIESDSGVVLGGSFRANVEVGTIRKPDGTISVTYTATDLTEWDG